MLASIIIPELVKSIEPFAFKDGSSLQNVKISSSITEVKESTFQNCLSLTSVDLPLNHGNIKNFSI